MFRQTHFVALILIALTFSFTMEAALPRYLCNLAVDEAAGPEAFDGRTVLARYQQLRKLLTTRSPDIHPLQMWILTILADHPRRGLTAKQVYEILVERKFNVGEQNVADSIERMMNRKRYIKQDEMDAEDESPRFAVRAEGLWEVINCLNFYARVKKLANETRKSEGASPIIDFPVDPDMMPSFPKLGHTQTVILALLAPEVEWILIDFAAEAIEKGLGTPSAFNDVYQTTREMAAKRLVRRVRPVGRPSSDREEFRLKLSSQEKGERWLTQTLRFFDQSFGMIAADNSLLINRLLLESHEEARRATP